jgi:WhiB family transcriptional regulator, redox-sensing transcriptional regulator
MKVDPIPGGVPLVTPAGDWAAKGTCATDPATTRLFFGPDNEHWANKAGREDAAVGVCNWCPVLAECREFAITNGIRHGVWGGLTEESLRAAIRRARKARPPSRGKAAQARNRATLEAREQSGQKRCSRCRKGKKLDEFGKDIHKLDGRNNRCLECRAEVTQQSRDARRQDRQGAAA